jgi:hypothetical protein
LFRGIGGGVLAAGITRVRFREFSIAAAVHCVVASVAVAYGRPPAAAAANVIVLFAANAVGVIGAYTTEARERSALLVDYQLALAHEAARKSGAKCACPIPPPPFTPKHTYTRAYTRT